MVDLLIRTNYQKCEFVIRMTSYSYVEQSILRTIRKTNQKHKLDILFLLAILSRYLSLRGLNDDNWIVKNSCPLKKAISGICTHFKQFLDFEQKKAKISSFAQDFIVYTRIFVVLYRIISY